MYNDFKKAPLPAFIYIAGKQHKVKGSTVRIDDIIAPFFEAYLLAFWFMLVHVILMPQR